MSDAHQPHHAVRRVLGAESYPDQRAPVARLEANRRVTIGWITLLIALTVTIIAASFGSPYVLEYPGPVFNTLGSDAALGQSQTDAKPLITISGAETYETDGSLDMLTVASYGEPENLPEWNETLATWFDPRASAILVDLVYPPKSEPDDLRSESTRQMQDSITSAKVAALTRLGYELVPRLKIARVIAGGAAAGVLQDDDLLQTFDGSQVADITTLRALLSKAAVGDTIQLGVKRGSEALQLPVTLKQGEAGPALGVELSPDFEFPIDIDIHLDQVGGPSAGTMFALGIIDMLTPGSLTGGEAVAGTGTIDLSGNVGSIGGIRQKMVAASEAGVKWFMAPAGNCDEVVGYVPDGLNVFAVKTLDDALNAVEQIASKHSIAGLPGCR